MSYFMTYKRNSEIGIWEMCNARTLTGAKREATAKYSGGFMDAVLLIGAGGKSNPTPYLIVARKANFTGARWATLR